MKPSVWNDPALRLPIGLAVSWVYLGPVCATFLQAMPAAAAPSAASASPGAAGTRYAPTAVSSPQRPPGMPGKAGPTATPEAPSAGLSSRVLEQAANLHGAIALRDWAAAAESAQALRRTLGEWIDDSPEALPMRGQLLNQLAAVPRLEQSIQNRQLRNANEEAYSLMQALLALGELTPGTTGGGGGSVAVSPGGKAEQQLRQGYRAVMLAHASLLKGDTRSAQAQLEQVRRALNAALEAKPGAVFTKRLEDLNQRRWRVLANIDNLNEARRHSRELARAYARAIHAVGNYAASQEIRPSPPARERTRSRG